MWYNWATIPGALSAPLPAAADPAAGPGYTVERAGGQVVLRGDFAAVVDPVGAANRAPFGATEVALDAATGEVVAVR